MEKQVSDLDQCVRGWDSEWERESVRLLCVRERVRVSKSAEWFVWGEWGVIFENTLFEIEYQTLGFTLSKPSLWDNGLLVFYNELIQLTLLGSKSLEQLANHEHKLV